MRLATAGARHFGVAVDRDARQFQAVLLHEAIKRLGVARSQPDAAVRRRITEAANMLRRMHRNAAIDKHRVRHRRVIVFARVPHLGHPLRAERAARRWELCGARRNRPSVFGVAIFRHNHRLLSEIDLRSQRWRGRRRGFDGRCSSQPVRLPPLQQRSRLQALRLAQRLARRPILRVRLRLLPARPSRPRLEQCRMAGWRRQASAITLKFMALENVAPEAITRERNMRHSKYAIQKSPWTILPGKMLNR